MASLARNRIGVQQADGTVRPPCSPAELDAVPALQALRDMLSISYFTGYARQEPSLSLALRRASAAAGVESQPAAPFEETIGWELLLAFRHFMAHIWADAPQLVRNGLTAAVVADAVHAATRVLAGSVRGCFTVKNARLQLKHASPLSRTPGLQDDGGCHARHAFTCVL